MNVKLRAFLELILASAFWGFGFVAAVWSLKRWNAVETTFLRFAIAGIAGLVILALLKKLTRQNLTQALKVVWPPSFFMALTLVLQTWGLVYTTATKSAFITTLYVLIVPGLEHFLSKNKVKPIFYLWVAIALFGTALLVNLKSFDSFNKGDFLTLLCAFSAAGHIYVVGNLANKVPSAFLFNKAQALWAAVFCLPMLLIPMPEIAKNAQVPTESSELIPIFGLLMLAFGSTMLAFTLQVRAQRVLSASTSSFIFLLESPFGFLFAALLLGETLDLIEVVGAILIFLSAVGVTWSTLRAESAAKA